MNAKTLLDSRKFCLIADDFARTWKDKKATDDDKEMRLEAMLGQILGAPSEKTFSEMLKGPELIRAAELHLEKIGPAARTAAQKHLIETGQLVGKLDPSDTIKPKRRYTKRKPLAEPAVEQVKETAPQGGFKLADDEPLAPKVLQSAIGYVDRQRALRKNPNIELNKAADIVQEAIKKNGWDASGTMQIPLPKGMSIVGLEAVLRERRLAFTAFMTSMPPRNQVISDSYKDISLDQADKISGGQGHRTGGWVVILTK